MANQERYYFYAPTWDCPPDGPIKLGNVLSSVKKADRPLAHFQPGDGSDVSLSEKRSVEYTSDKLRDGRFSILTKWLSLLGLGVDVGYEHSKRDEVNFTFDRIETTQFTTSPEFLQRCLGADHVLRFLKQSRYRKPLYIITGIKVAFGAEAKSTRERTRSTALAVEVDGSIWSGGIIPIGGGPGGNTGVARSQTMGWKGSSDFVFAYRVSKVTVSRKSGEVVKESEYRKGAMLEDKVLGVEHPELSITGVKELDAVEEGFDVEDVTEDDQSVKCVYIVRDDDE